MSPPRTSDADELISQIDRLQEKRFDALEARVRETEQRLCHRAQAFEKRVDLANKECVANFSKLDRELARLQGRNAAFGVIGGLVGGAAMSVFVALVLNAIQ